MSSSGAWGGGSYIDDEWKEWRAFRNSEWAAALADVAAAGGGGAAPAPAAPAPAVGGLAEPTAPPPHTSPVPTSP